MGVKKFRIERFEEVVKDIVIDDEYLLVVGLSEPITKIKTREMLKIAFLEVDTENDCAPYCVNKWALEDMRACGNYVDFLNVYKAYIDLKLNGSSFEFSSLDKPDELLKEYNLNYSKLSKMSDEELEKYEEDQNEFAWMVGVVKNIVKEM